MALHERLYGYISEIVLATTNAYGNYETSLQVGQNATKNLLFFILIPIAIIAVIAIIGVIFSILNYRTNRKILKKLGERETPNE